MIQDNIQIIGSSICCVALISGILFFVLFPVTFDFYLTDIGQFFIAFSFIIFFINTGIYLGVLLLIYLLTSRHIPFIKSDIIDKLSTPESQTAYISQSQLNPISSGALNKQYIEWLVNNNSKVIDMANTPEMQINYLAEINEKPFQSGKITDSYRDWLKNKVLQLQKPKLKFYTWLEKVAYKDNLL